MLNEITLMGRLTKAPEISFYNKADGTSGKLATYTLAVPRDASDETDFFHCVTFGKNANFAEQYFIKGLMLTVTGSIHLSKNKKDNKEYTNVSVFVAKHYPCQSITKQTVQTEEEMQQENECEQIDELNV